MSRSANRRRRNRVRRERRQAYIASLSPYERLLHDIQSLPESEWIAAEKRMEAGDDGTIGGE